MAIRTVDTNPKFSNEKVKEVLRLETEIDKFLIDHTLNGKASYMVMSHKDVADILIKRYEKQGWIVKIAYSGDYLFRLEFEDPEQIMDSAKKEALSRKTSAIIDTKTYKSHTSNIKR